MAEVIISRSTYLSPNVRRLLGVVVSVIDVHVDLRDAVIVTRPLLALESSKVQLNTQF